MKQVISTERLPIKMWLDNIEEGALEQAKNLANLPFAYKHIALMPDCHWGYGMPIGGVLATENVVIPNAVGVDIGCGMCAVKTSLKKIDTETLKTIMGGIRSKIPLGFNKHKKEQSLDFMPLWKFNHKVEIYPVINKEFSNARKSLGSLGGGNHFIEIQKGSDGFIWIMIHSGSRNLGYKVAKHYNEVAKELNKIWYTPVPTKWDLACLPLSSKEADSYLLEMNYCVNFAYVNRKLMMDRIIDIFAEKFGNNIIFQATKNVIKSDRTKRKIFEIEPMINIAHNYVQQENHFGKNVWVHRKGATLAREDTIGIIPGSQGTKSYIVKGKGNKDSFCSCSHGAGRRLGRKAAKRELNLQDEIDNLNKQGIIHSVRNQNDLDEAPSAYKDIFKVMENQSDLVEILVELTPLAVIKG